MLNSPTGYLSMLIQPPAASRQTSGQISYRDRKVPHPRHAHTRPGRVNGRNHAGQRQATKPAAAPQFDPTISIWIHGACARKPPHLLVRLIMNAIHKRKCQISGQPGRQCAPQQIPVCAEPSRRIQYDVSIPLYRISNEARALPDRACLTSSPREGLNWN